MSIITVATANLDGDRCRQIDQLLQGEAGITLLGNFNASSGYACDDRNGRMFGSYHVEQRPTATSSISEVDWVKRIKPRVMLVNLLKSNDDLALLLTLRSECPEVYIVLLADDSIRETELFQALEIGARGFMREETVSRYLPTAIRVVGRGEAWVPRKMLGGLMDRRNELVASRYMLKAGNA